jgi:Flp pilus assembly CpaF family ATPase
MSEDRYVVASLRRLVADEIAQQQRLASEAAGGVLDGADQRQMARAIVNRELDLRAREALRLGTQPPTDAERTELTRQVLAQTFSPLPGLEMFVERDDAVNIHVQGCRQVVVELADGTREDHESPFATDAELQEVVAQVARRSGVVEKEFNYSHPMLHMTLPDGSRLTANSWIGTETFVTIRRHPMVDRDLDDLSGAGMFDRGMRTLLGAAVRARMNVLFAGGQGTGKTTLMRAAAHDASPNERTLVLESEPELMLDRSPERHRQVIGLWERPANMEGDGAVTLADLVWHAKRLTPDRILVGEVLGDEVIPMLEAMSQGIRGSMCTMHAESSAAVFPRLPVYARSRGRDWLSGDVLQLAALALDLVVFVARDVAGRRVVAEVRHVDRYDPDTSMVISDAWFSPDPLTGRAARSSVIPVHVLDELTAFGYDPTGHDESRLWP